MKKIVLLYSAGLALSAMFLSWLQYRHVTRLFTTEIYIFILAILFTILGVWFGYRMTARSRSMPFTLNESALESLGMTSREHNVLVLMAKGRSNKEIARTLGISPNTVKTHATHIFEKMRVSRRTEAINIGRSLQLIP